MWLKQGYWLFKQNPFIWMVLTAILVVGMAGISMFPLVGGPLSTLLLPGFFAGLMLGCHALAKEEKLELMHLFAGFQKHGTPLIALGGISLVGKLLIMGAVMLTGGAKLLEILTSGKQTEDPEAVLQAFTEAGFAFPMGVGLSILLQTCVQLAAMLVVFRAVAPLPAMVAVFRATLRNVLPLTVYGLILLPFAALASVPMMLGWLVLLPIFITSQYAMYRDMFPMAGDIQEAPDGGASPGDTPPGA